MAVRDLPLVVLPGGFYITESDLRRIQVRRHLRFVVELVVFGALFLTLLFATTFAPVAP